MTEPLVYVNGRFVAASEATVSVFDRGFLYGDSVFETLRAYNGRIFAMAEHHERLCASARLLGIVLPFTRTEYAEILAGCLAENGYRNALIRLTVSRGSGTLPTPSVSGCNAPTVVALPRPASDFDPGAWERGIAVLVSPVQARPVEVLDPAVKCGNFLSHILALEHAHAHGADEAILLNRKSNVAEGAVSNLFGVWEGVLNTPALDCGILPGVTRRVVLELAGELALPAAEISIAAAELLGADELFVTNSGWEVMPVTRLDGEAVGEGVPGPVTRRLAEAFRRHVAVRLG